MQINPGTLHSRFSNIVPEHTRNMTVLIAGAGMVGSWTALAITRMVKHVDIYDPDTIEPENVGVQSYTANELGLHKVTAIEQQVRELPLRGYPERVTESAFSRAPNNRPYDVLILAVDSMKARKEIATMAHGTVHHIIDTRVLGDIAYTELIASVPDYLTNLPSDEEVVQARCGAKGTAYAGMWVASRVCAILNNIGHGIPATGRQLWHIGMNEEITAGDA